MVSLVMLERKEKVKTVSNGVLLVLGSDYCTLQVVKEAKAMGYYVIVADLMEKSPTKEAADEAWLISTTDIDLLIDKCKKHSIKGIMFGASDFNINNARIICKKLNLSIYCSDDYAWKVARDKREFKNLCKYVGAPIADDYELDDYLNDDSINKIKFPVVVKPSDKSGNRGMSYCNNKQELIEAYQNVREISDASVIIERKLVGQEYNVHYAIAEGIPSLLYFSSTHHEPGQAENLYSFKCTTSAYLKQYIEEVNDKAVEVIKKSGCKEGIAWFDCIRDNDGHFYLLEMGHRFGGVMTYVPYEKVSGFNTTKWMIECAVGVKHTVADLPKELNEAYKGCAGSYHLFSNSEDVIVSIEGLDNLSKVENIFIDLPKREGNSLRYHACSGLIGIYGKDVYDLCDKLRRINELLFIKNSNGSNMFIKFDDYEGLIKEYKKGLRQFIKDDTRAKNDNL